MLKAAQLYTEELQRKVIETWYDPDSMYWNGEMGSTTVELPEDCINSHHFVSVDKDDNVIGYICYSIDWTAMSAEDFGIISFDRWNMEFGRDLMRVVDDLFEKYKMNRISWYCHADNPAIKAYRNFVRTHGGAECGYFHEYTKLSDGKLHDSVMFEIMAKSYIEEKNFRFKMKVCSSGDNYDFLKKDTVVDTSMLNPNPISYYIGTIHDEPVDFIRP